MFIVCFLVDDVLFTSSRNTHKHKEREKRAVRELIITYVKSDKPFLFSMICLIHLLSFVHISTTVHVYLNDSFLSLFPPFVETMLIANKFFVCVCAFVNEETKRLINKPNLISHIKGTLIPCSKNNNNTLKLNYEIWYGKMNISLCVLTLLYAQQ